MNELYDYSSRKINNYGIDNAKKIEELQEIYKSPNKKQRNNLYTNIYTEIYRDTEENICDDDEEDNDNETNGKINRDEIDVKIDKDESSEESDNNIVNQKRYLVNYLRYLFQLQGLRILYLSPQNF